MTQNKKAQSQKSVIIQRTIAAAPEKVFAAWTNPDLLLQWWSPPGAKVTSVEMDLRVNGRYRIGIQQPNNAIYFVNGTYQIIQPPEKLVFTWRWEQPEMDIGESLVTIELSGENGRTHLCLTHAKLPHEPARTAHRHGWEGILGSLGTFLETHNV